MTDIGVLIDISPREAWLHEARHFTPWLANNLDRLSDAIGVPLELEGTEVAVEGFSADILARNLADGSLILIENQLEATDHGHLGQIMTYLAGLAAKTVIWIANDFREPHLSAVRWLNQHTADPFAFFAIRLRVVRIGESLPAPIFDVLERPNEWERRLQTATQEQREIGAVAQFRREFWAAYRERSPEDVSNGAPQGGSNWWWLVGNPDLVISTYVSVAAIGLFVRGRSKASAEDTYREIEPFRTTLEARLGASLGEPYTTYLFGQEKQISILDRANWPEAMAWMNEKARAYHSVLTETLRTGN